jgi:ketosteroid isomerase-like protein
VKTSQENLMVAERGLAAINETYRSGDLDAWRRHVEEVFDPGVVLESETGAFTEGRWQGHDGAIAFVTNQMEVFEDMWLRIDEYFEPYENCLIVPVTFGGRARHTGIELELHPVHVFILRDGKAVRWQIFPDREQADAAVGAGD